MDGPWPQNAVYDFAIALPTSIVAVMMLVISAGWLRDRRDQPRWFQFLAARLASRGEPNPPNWGGIGFAIILWGFVNLQPLVALFIWPYGWTGRAVVLASFLAQGIWVMDMRRAIVRARIRHHNP